MGGARSGQGEGGGSVSLVFIALPVPQSVGMPPAGAVREGLVAGSSTGLLRCWSLTPSHCSRPLWGLAADPTRWEGAGVPVVAVLEVQREREKESERGQGSGDRVLAALLASCVATLWDLTRMEVKSLGNAPQPRCLSRIDLTPGYVLPRLPSPRFA